MTVAYNTDTVPITGNTGYPDGFFVGNSITDKISHYGVSAIAQPAASAQAAVTTTAPTLTSFGFATSAQAVALIALVNQLRSDMVSLGLIKGSA